ncbi:MAG: MMPL family transporter [Bacteriovoracaceae bacterium]|nr:MMPL family transporter [Bacteriovoracaceae bacterium]
MSYLFTLALLPGLAQLKLDFDVRIWFREDDPKIQDFDNFIEKFGTENYVFLALVSPDGIFHQQTLKDISDITNQLWKNDKVVRVDSLTNFTDIQSLDGNFEAFPLIRSDFNYNDEEMSKLRSYVLAHPMLPGLYVSRQGESAHFLIRLDKPNADQMTHGETIDEIRELLKPYKNYDFKIVGTATVVDELKKIGFKDNILIIPLLMFFVGLIIYLTLRNYMSVLLVFQVILLSSVATLSIAGFMGLKLNNLSAMVPSVIMAIGITDAIHFLAIYFLQRKNHLDSAIYSLNKNYVGTILTTVSTSIGFLSLGTSDLLPIRDFGILCGIGSVLAWFYCVFTIFPILMLTKYHPHANPESEGTVKFPSPVNFCLAHYKKINLFFVVFSLGFAYLGIQNKVNSNPFEYFNHDLKIYQDNQYMNKSYGGFSSFEMVLDSGKADGIYETAFLSKVDQLEQWMRKEIGVSYISSIVNFVKMFHQADHAGDKTYFSLPESSEKTAQYLMYYSFNLPANLDLRNFISLDQQHTRMSVFWSIQDSKHYIEATEKIKAKAEELGLPVMITGREYLFNGMNDYVVYSFIDSFGSSIITIGILLGFLFRSFFLGLISMLPNIVPVLFGAGCMTLMGKPIDVGTVLVGSVCFGIATDDTIHFLLDIKKMQGKELSLADKLNEVFSETGFALLSASLILVISFLIFLIADFVPNYNFGLFSAIILGIAFLTDFFFLVSLIIYFSHKKIIKI